MNKLQVPAPCFPIYSKISDLHVMHGCSLGPISLLDITEGMNHNSPWFIMI